MSESASIGAVIALAVVLANLPFVSNRWLGLWPARAAKALPGRMLEWLAFYLLTGAVGLALEKRAGQLAPQGWEFYAITLALFLTLAFPGFTYRYLIRRGH